MGNRMNKIIPGVYVGNYRDAKDIKQLEENKITHVLAVHDQAKKLHPELEYLCITASDCASQDLTQYFSQCNDFIHKARLEGGNVLIHCLAGVSRSVTVTAAYIMSVTDLNWKHSLNAIRGARHCSNPNYGFQKQLQDYNYGRLEKERKRLRETYPPVPHPDKEVLEKLLECHRDWVINGDTPPDFDTDDFEQSKRKNKADTSELEKYNVDTITERLNEIKSLSSEQAVSVNTVNIKPATSHSLNVKHASSNAPKTKKNAKPGKTSKHQKPSIFTEKELYDPDDFIKFIDEDSDSANANAFTSNDKDKSNVSSNPPILKVSGPSIDDQSNISPKDTQEIVEET